LSAADGFLTIFRWTPCCWPRIGSSFYLMV